MWSGDSRIYIIREGEISQISRDHTEVQDLLISGVITPEQAETWSGSNAITRAIGVVDLPELEVTSGALNAGDVFVMCTDGLTRMWRTMKSCGVLHEHVTAGLRPANRAHPRAGCR